MSWIHFNNCTQFHRIHKYGSRWVFTHDDGNECKSVEFDLRGLS